MLRFLLDAHISPTVREQIMTKQPAIEIHTLQTWLSGELLQAEDEAILLAAHANGFTFVTYDQKTIPPLISRWAKEERSHAGIIFVDEKSISQGDIGGKVSALLDLWETSHSHDWTNAIKCLKQAK